jgi:branched-chain amino acid transport system permease protein
MGIAAIFAISYNLLLGQTGLLSFGHAVYFGLGGYAAIHLLRAVNAGLAIPVPLVPLAGALAGLAAGIAIGAVATRRAGTIFALITLGIGELVHAASLMLPALFGGEEGITASRTRAPHFLGLDFGSQVQVYYVIASWLMVAAFVALAFMRTPVGRMCNAVRDNPERAEFVGYNPQRVRFIACSVAAMLAGLAGGLHAINYEIVTSEAVGATRSGEVLLMVYIGGVHHFAGAILGAVAITWLQVSLSSYTSAWLLYLGLLFMAMILYAPGGLAAIAAKQVAAGAKPRRGRGAARLRRHAAGGIDDDRGRGDPHRDRVSPVHAARGGHAHEALLDPMNAATPWPWLGAAMVTVAGLRPVEAEAQWLTRH